MTISESTEVFAGKPVKEYDPEVGLADPSGTAYRIHIDWERYEDDESAPELLEVLVEDPNAARLEALVFGDPGGTAEGNDSGPVVEALVRSKERLPALRALFIGDMTYEECEISWIQQSDVSSLFEAYPRLEELRIRGGEGLSLGTPKHSSLRRLVIETGGLSRTVLAELARSQLPSLEHLELWLGDVGYGWDGTIDDVRPLLAPGRFPRLTSLGLRNAMISDEIAEALADTPLLEQLEVLDLSLGTLTDRGAMALARSEATRRLRKLDVHHHYLTPVGAQALEALGIEVDLDERRDPEDGDRFVAVSE